MEPFSNIEQIPVGQIDWSHHEGLAQVSSLNFHGDYAPVIFDALNRHLRNELAEVVGRLDIRAKREEIELSRSGRITPGQRLSWDEGLYVELTEIIEERGALVRRFPQPEEIPSAAKNISPLARDYISMINASILEFNNLEFADYREMRGKAELLLNLTSSSQDYFSRQV